MGETDLDLSLIQSIRESELVPVATDLTEVGLDAIMDQGLLKDIPIIGSFVNLCKAGRTIQGRMYARKLLLFLRELSKVPKAKRLAAIDKIESDPKHRKKTGETLLLLLDRMNDTDKPVLMARAYTALLEDRISYDQFLQFAFIIDMLNMASVPTLEEAYRRSPPFKTSYPNSHVQHLSAAGLFSMRLTPDGTKTKKPKDDGKTFSTSINISHAIITNDTGRLFCEVVLALVELPTAN
jgi:hypothetical protein